MCTPLFFVECAHLPLSDLLDHMKKMMEGRRTREWAAINYTNILVGQILPMSHHSLNITADQWESECVVGDEIADQFTLP